MYFVCSFYVSDRADLSSCDRILPSVRDLLLCGPVPGVEPGFVSASSRAAAARTTTISSRSRTGISVKAK
jgi:hypothetical protein